MNEWTLLFAVVLACVIVYFDNKRERKNKIQKVKDLAQGKEDTDPKPWSPFMTPRFSPPPPPKAMSLNTKQVLHDLMKLSPENKRDRNKIIGILMRNSK